MVGQERKDGFVSRNCRNTAKIYVIIPFKLRIEMLSMSLEKVYENYFQDSYPMFGIVIICFDAILPNLN